MDRGLSKAIHVDRYTGGLVGPSLSMVGPLANGGVLTADTAPGCWGPMITPAFKGGHEVTVPVAVENAEPGDALVVRIRKVRVLSMATASGTMSFVEGRYSGDPFVARQCPSCGTRNPATHLEGIGARAVRCDRCGAEASPFRVSHGYTIAFDEKRQAALTVSLPAAEALARDARAAMALPEHAKQNPIVALCPSDLAGVAARLRPFIGNIGTTPAVDMPDSHNAGDFGQLLVGATHEYGLTKDALERVRTDGHMDVDSVREGAILLCPVKVPGGGLYIGDAHAMQGDGEIAGHTTDIAAHVELEVSVLKGIDLGGPLLLPPMEDLPHLARPFSAEEKAAAQRLAGRHGMGGFEDAAPIQMIGSGANLNDAVDNAVARLSRLLVMSREEVQNRITLTGAIEIGRLPGVVTATLRAPLATLERLGLAELVKSQYGI